jgi:UDP-N-acetylmuramoyl-L-alanyl-D-glutamate--2,6-diaminopimelate ligase
MLLSEVTRIAGQGTAHLKEDGEILGLCYDSRQVRSGDLFFALKGGAADGHRFIAPALERGAIGVVLEDLACAPENGSWIQVDDARRAMALTAAAFYGNPTGQLLTVGVTGTNGKTTTTYLVEAVLDAADIPAAVFGTVAYRFKGKEFPSSHTTPESVELQRLLAEMLAEGARGVAMEVSSHSLQQHRVDGCCFDVAVFTNLTPEHLDYHGDMEEYYRAKARLFTTLLAQKDGAKAVINGDDPFGVRLAGDCPVPVLTFGMAEGCDVRAVDVAMGIDGIRGMLVTPAGSIPFSSPLVGRFNLANLLGAVATGIALAIPLERIAAGIAGARTVPGRLERVDNGCGLTILVDYAHTGDALENVLKTIREVTAGRLITVFGCGGDRDRTKRPVMGELAVRYSDLAVVTSDNPRTESPAAILDEVCSGITPTGARRFQSEEVAGGFSERGYVVLEQRREAIRLAVGSARPGDVILIAGKGHEDYQIVGTERHHFDDREEAAAACSLKREGAL